MHDVQERRIFLSLYPIRHQANSLTLRPQNRICEFGLWSHSRGVHDRLSIGADAFNERLDVHVNSSRPDHTISSVVTTFTLDVRSCSLSLIRTSRFIGPDHSDVPPAHVMTTFPTARGVDHSTCVRFSLTCPFPVHLEGLRHILQGSESVRVGVTPRLGMYLSR